MTSLVEGFLARRDASGVVACSCGHPHRIAAGEVLVTHGALAVAADLLYRRHGQRPAVWVLSDENTEAAAGARWKTQVGVRGAAIRSRVLPAIPRPVPSMDLVDHLAAEVRRAAPDLLVAVGGGVVSDLVKKVSLDVGPPSWCIATAPSVDAYSSATASLHIGGYHQTTPARISEVIVCDLDVIGAAPRQLFLAGLGDLLAKFLAYLDWGVAHLVTGEHHCQMVADLALESARAAARAAQQLDADPAGAARSLTDAILVSGLAMQAMGGSRPAASAEHTIAHFWETTHAASSRGLDLHGILVGAAAALILPGYLDLYGRLPAAPAIEDRLAAHAAQAAPPLEPAMQPFADHMADLRRVRALSDEVLSARLEAFGRERARIAELAGPLLAELSASVRALERLGFPFSLAELGIPERLRMPPVRHTRLLRDRYTTFDLAHELGCEDRLLSAIAAASA